MTTTIPPGPSFSTTPNDPDRLFAGDFPRVTVQGTVTPDTPRGSALYSADGETWILAVQATHTEITGVLAEDSTGGVVEKTIYVSGEFNIEAMTFGAGYGTASQTVIDLTKLDAAKRSIFIKQSKDIAGAG